MKKIVIIFGLTIVSIIMMVVMKLLNTSEIMSSTDLSKVKHHINIGVDNWAGYFFLCSKELRKKALENEILINCIIDDADTESRMSGLKEKNLQMAAFTVDSFVKNGEKEKNPAKIVAVIDESQGGDAIYINKNIANNVDELRENNNIKVGYTKNSPSELLFTTWKKDFGLKNNFNVIETNGSIDAYKKLISGELDVAVVWQPETIKIEKNKKFKKLMGSEQTKNIIVDILVVENNFLINNENLVKKFLELYYETMDYYNLNEGEFDKELKEKTGIISDDEIIGLKDGINWINYNKLAIEWMGINYNGEKGYIQLYDSINMVTNIMKNDNQIEKDYNFPNNDAFSMINSTILQKMVDDSLVGNGLNFDIPKVINDVSISRKFKKLSPAKWNLLRERNRVGSINIEPITFSTGTHILYPNYNDQESFDTIIEILKKYPKYRLIIEGHTGKGNEVANMDLSKKRANEVKRVLIEEIGLDKNRIMTIGYGATNPPKRNIGENKMSWWKRWSRVDIIVVQD